MVTLRPTKSPSKLFVNTDDIVYVLFYTLLIFVLSLLSLSQLCRTDRVIVNFYQIIFFENNNFSSRNVYFCHLYDLYTLNFRHQSCYLSLSRNFLLNLESISKRSKPPESNFANFIMYD